MTPRTCTFSLLAALAFGVIALPAPSAEPAGAAVSRLGRYELVRRDDRLEIRTPRELRFAAALGGSGLLIAGLSFFVGAGGRRGGAIAMALLGAALAAVGGISLLGSSRWVASPVELVRERGGGRVDRWRHEEIQLVQVRRRPPSAEDLKTGRRRPSEVRVLRLDGSRLARFTLATERDARALARELAGVLRVEVSEE
jgi:hypothetical protein